VAPVAPNHPALVDLISLKGRTAIVTGAAQGIGEAIARRLAEAGAAVFLGDINDEAAQRVAEDIRAHDAKAIAGRLDVSDPENVEATLAGVANELGTVDILVNNVGIYPPIPLGELDLARWRRVLQTNVDGALLCARAVAPGMIKARSGVIVNITSTGAARPQTAGMAAYASSKHALDGLTKALALEYGPFGIRALSVAPTLVATPGVVALSAGTDVSELAARIDSMIPLRRAGVPDDVARVVLFCVSELAAFVSGSTIYVDGGGMTV
jgi:NAD(P)-dependent dehydrogenase (short-subunit alcohol dehydrogenase family)